MKKLKVGLNGFGRIGRAVMRIAHERDTFDVVAVNTRSTQPEMMAYLLKYDTPYQTFPHDVTHDNGAIYIDGEKVAALHNSDPESIPWEDHGVDVVIDATGAFKDCDSLDAHLSETVQKVILTCPCKDDMPMVVLGVNDGEIDFENERIFSMASCTTNCSSPVFKVLQDSFGIQSGLLTTVHAVTTSQPILDEKAKTFARSRSAMSNIIPTTTGAAKAVGKVIPELDGKLDGVSLRVPVLTGSIVDISAVLDREVTLDEVHNALQSASVGSMKGILGFETVEKVSSDFIGDTRSSIIDPHHTKVQGNHVKIFAWYDNEWGYSERLCDFVEKFA